MGELEYEDGIRLFRHASRDAYWQRYARLLTPHLCISIKAKLKSNVRVWIESGLHKRHLIEICSLSSENMCTTAGN